MRYPRRYWIAFGVGVVALVLVTLGALAYAQGRADVRHQQTLLCANARDNRTALRDLANEVLGPVRPTDKLSDELARLIAEADPIRAQRLSEFVMRYPALTCDE